MSGQNRAKQGPGCQNQKEAGRPCSPTESSPKLISAPSRGQLEMGLHEQVSLPGAWGLVSVIDAV